MHVRNLMKTPISFMLLFGTCALAGDASASHAVEISSNITMTVTLKVTPYSLRPGTTYNPESYCSPDEPIISTHKEIVTFVCDNMCSVGTTTWQKDLKLDVNGHIVEAHFGLGRTARRDQPQIPLRYTFHAFDKVDGINGSDGRIEFLQNRPFGIDDTSFRHDLKLSSSDSCPTIVEISAKSSGQP